MKRRYYQIPLNHPRAIKEDDYARTGLLSKETLPALYKGGISNLSPLLGKGKDFNNRGFEIQNTLISGSRNLQSLPLNVSLRG